jgi:hypothetical protein
VLRVPDIPDHCRGRATADLSGNHRAARREGDHRGFVRILNVDLIRSRVWHRRHTWKKLSSDYTTAKLTSRLRRCGTAVSISFASYMEFHEIGTPVDDLQSFVKHRPERITPTPWHNCRSARELAAAIHDAALDKYPQSDYAKTYGRPN